METAVNFAAKKMPF